MNRTVKVKHHNRISKKSGKIIPVNEHVRNDRITKIKSFVSKHIRNKNLTRKDVILFVIKELKVKDMDKIKRLTFLIHNSLTKRTDSANAQAEKDYNFKYWHGGGSPIKSITKPEHLDVGDTFYNQKTKAGETWRETLKRKDLVIAQIGRKSFTDSGRTLEVTFFKPLNDGKKLKTVKKKMKAEDVFKMLKKGGSYE